MNTVDPSTSRRLSGTSSSRWIRCPKCGSSGTMHHSHSKNFLEKAIKQVFPLRIYRCHQCGYRLWHREGVWFRGLDMGEGDTIPVWVWILIMGGVIILGVLVGSFNNWAIKWTAFR